MRAEKEKTAKIKPELKVKPENRAPKRQHSEVVHDEDGEGDDDEISITSVVALNTKRARTAGPASVEVLTLLESEIMSHRFKGLDTGVDAPREKHRELRSERGLLG